MPAEVRIRGLEKLRRTLKAAGVDMADMKAANTRAAQTVAREGETRSPRRSGKLAGSLVPARQVARARVYSNLVYAGAIHWGWPKHNIRAQEFLVEAAVATQPEWLGEYERELQAIADSVQGAP
jgi:phage gpG-like protein